MLMLSIADAKKCQCWVMIMLAAWMLNNENSKFWVKGMRRRTTTKRTTVILTSRTAPPQAACSQKLQHLLYLALFQVQYSHWLRTVIDCIESYCCGTSNTAKSCTEYSQNICSVVAEIYRAKISSLILSSIDISNQCWKQWRTF